MKGQYLLRNAEALSVSFPIILTLIIISVGCIDLDRVIPEHSNSGDRVTVEDWDGSIPTEGNVQLRFGPTSAQSIYIWEPSRVVVTVPQGLSGSAPISLWVNGKMVSNVLRFIVDVTPLVYRILAFGDSLVGPTAWYPQELDTLLNNSEGPAQVINAGESGETIQEGAARFSSTLLIYDHAGFVFIEEGANDVTDTANTPLPLMETALDQMVQTARSHGVTPLIMTLPPRTRAALLIDQTPPTTQDWNQSIRDYALATGTLLIELYDAILSQPEWESLLDEGGLHLSTAGNEFVANYLYQLFLPLLY